MALPDFPEFQPGAGDYVLRSGNDNLVFYSERSGARDTENLRQLLKPNLPGMTPLVIAPYRHAFGELFTPELKGFLISPFVFDAPISHPQLIADEPGLEHFINAIAAEDKFEIIALPQWGPVKSEICAAMQKILERAAVRLKTISHFGRLWQINFRLNSARLDGYQDVSALRTRGIPDVLAMAGPTLDAQLSALTRSTKIWCADTALPALLARNFTPQVVFSVDAGFASNEHFCGHSTDQMTLVTDLLAAPAVQRRPFRQILTYHSSHPLVDTIVSKHSRTFTHISNPQGDVGSLMLAVFANLFGPREIRTIGHDRGQRRFVTHARGTAYFSRSYFFHTRVRNAESYMLRLSRRY